MTSVEHVDTNGFKDVLVEVYRIPDTYIGGKAVNLDKFPVAEIKKRESEMIVGLEANGHKILSVKSQLISKRRYKRRLAKENKRRARFA